MENRMGLDKDGLPIIGSKWMYDDVGPLEVVEIIPHSSHSLTNVKCKNLGRGYNPWMGTLSCFAERPYRLLEVPLVGGAMQLGLDAAGKPLINSTWAATINNTHKDVFRIVEYVGSDAQLELIERDGQKRNERSHIWPIKNFTLQYGKELKLLSLPTGGEMLTAKSVDVYLDSKLGLDKEGKPVIGSIWDGHEAEGWSKEEVYRITGVVEIMATLSKVSNNQTGSWNWKRIVEKWKLCSIPTPVDPDAIPVLKKKTRQDPLGWEKLMQECELAGNFAGAKQYAKSLPVAHKTHNSYLAEENAVAEKRVIREVQLKKMETGDRKLLEMKVKSFIHYADQMAGWLWFE